MSRAQREIEWCGNVLLPLFMSMERFGLYDVRYNHGTNEFGKDFTFYYYDPLKQPVYCGVQAKWGKISGGSTDIDELVGQINNALAVPYRWRPKEAERNISQLFIICSDGYTDNAIQVLESRVYHTNVYFFDGLWVDEQKRRLERSNIETERTLQQILFRALVEIDLNLLVAGLIADDPTSPASLREHYLENLHELPMDGLEIMRKWRGTQPLISVVNNLAVTAEIADMIGGVGALKRRKETAAKIVQSLKELEQMIKNYLSQKGWPEHWVGFNPITCCVEAS